ncbi:sulfotransferase 1A1-like [Aplysia californica]|uniref:Sulfotransferase 1A1-like n=1 Tax=Aplysia californica TaxID=6500 RepID=A0ABM1ADU4_APLCA|nr:sulfotransferase 1A1-like [Aplysia californica]
MNENWSYLGEFSAWTSYFSPYKLWALYIDDIIIFAVFFFFSSVNGNNDNDSKKFPEIKGIDPKLLKVIDGVTYFAFSAADRISLRSILDNVRNFQVRDDDVFVAGFPRSGNHWAFEVVNMILRGKLEFAEVSFHTRILELMDSCPNERLKEVESPRQITSHSKLSVLPKQIVEKKAKVIFLIRNPKDAMLSMFRLYSVFKNERFRYTGTWEEFLELQFQERFMHGGWFDQVLDVERFMKNHPDVPVYVHSFEKMKENPVEATRALCKFLGRPEDLVEDIANVTQFRNMKEKLDAGKLGKVKDQVFQQGSEGILQKGATGGWKNAFTVAQSEAFDRVFQEKMAGSELAKLVLPYMK